MYILLNEYIHQGCDLSKPKLFRCLLLHLSHQSPPPIGLGHHTFFLIHFLLSFTKYLTNTKFTGTQIANIGMGAHAFGMPSWRKTLSVSNCNR